MLWYITLVSVVTVQVSVGIRNWHGWGYITLHCRDNGNAPVDWWYIYKPPSQIVPYLDVGLNFSYIVSSTPSKWQESDKHINGNSMLQHTLMPLFRKTYQNLMAYVIYERRQKSKTKEGTTAYGVLMSDETGGFWLGHNMPGFPNLAQGFPSIPKKEAPNGHLMYCISLDLVTLNQLAISIKNAQPKILAINIPSVMKPHVKAWAYLTEGPKFLRESNTKWLSRDNFDFLSRKNTVKASIQVRWPGQTNCMYRDFARQRNIVLDVYGHGLLGNHKKTLCTEIYSLRSINQISLKLPERRVHYIPQSADRARFAVSTGAHWQRRGGQHSEYWTCISSMLNEDKEGEGGILFCMEGYQAWVNFDNLKVSEPKCIESTDSPASNS